MPSELNVWVHRDFIEHDEVVAPRLNIRSGPGVNYSVMGLLERGARIRRRGEFAEWISIVPPDGISVWISSDLVEIVSPEPPPPPPPPLPAAIPDPAPEPPPAPSPPSRPPPPPPDDLSLIPLEGQGEMVQREGTLRPAGFFFGRPSRYRLTQERGNSIETIAFVRGQDAQLQSLLGHQLVITGREYWVQGARYPVLVPEQIMLRPPDS